MTEVLLPGEGKNLEYKEVIPGNTQNFVKTVIAFANGEGGKIVFGVNDKTHEVTGVDSGSVFSMIDAVTNAIADSCTPPIVPDIYMEIVQEKTVIVVEVPPGQFPPYYIKSKGVQAGTYVRVAASTRVAPESTLQELILRGTGRSFDRLPCPELAVSEDDIEQLCRKLTGLARANAGADAQRGLVKAMTKEVLLSWGVLSQQGEKVVATNAYALLTGKAKTPAVQCAVFKGTDRGYFVDRRKFTGSVLDQADAAFQYVLEKINRGVRVHGLYREDVFELPTAAVREAIANAVVHRSYLEGADIQVALFDDRLEITSPGAVLLGVSVEKMRRGVTKFRNRLLGQVFAYANIIEMWGNGIRLITEECRRMGLGEPELLDLEGDFRINIFRAKEDGTASRPGLAVQKLTAEEKQLIGLLRKNPALSRAQLSDLLHWPDYRVKYFCDRLKKGGFMHREGTLRQGLWVFDIDAGD